MFYTVDGVDLFMSAEQARERMCSALDAIDAAHEVLRQTPSAVVGNAFRVDFAERLEAQDRLNRGLMYRVFGEIAEPPDEAGCVPAMRGMLWARLRIPPKEVTRRFRLAARLRSRRSLTGAPLEPPGTADAPTPIAWNPGITARWASPRFTMRTDGQTEARRRGQPVLPLRIGPRRGGQR